MKILTVVGARPQFVKAGIVSRSLMTHDRLTEVIVHTGQHYDPNMSDIFFGQLGIPRPDHQLSVAQKSHGRMTGHMLAEIDRLIELEEPDRVLVYGDTNSTLAGALAAVKMHVPVAHVEAGLRSFNMRMPEEVNRLLTDQISDILFCPTDAAVENLEAEGARQRQVQIVKVGDVMQDSAIHFSESAFPPPADIPADGFILATLHRAENTDDPERLASIVAALNTLHGDGYPVVLPLHPRTRKALNGSGLSLTVQVIDPVGYLEMLWLLNHCELVATDSGGVQKEAYFFGRSCLTMRDETEWVELVDLGANTLVGADTEIIVSAARQNFGRRIEDSAELYGGGSAATRIADILDRI